jgi:adenylate cyclase
LAARIDRLDDASKQVLQTAAVIGNEIAEPLLERVGDMDGDTLQSGLRRLVQSEFLYQASLYPENEYAFKHPLTREVAYASLLRERRRALHAEVARALQALAGDTVDQRAPLIAHHWEQAGRALEAARWHARIADRLGWNVGEAIVHWRKVTELLGEERDVPEARALLGQARARLVYAAGRNAVPEAEVAQFFAEARLELGDSDSRELAVTLASYAIVRSAAGHVEEAQRLIADALAMARRLDHPDLIAMSLVSSCSVYPWSEWPDMAAQIVLEMNSLYAANPSVGEKLGGARSGVIAAGVDLLALFHRGRGGEVEASLAECRRRVGDSRNPMEQVWLNYCVTVVRARQGDASGALEHGRQSLEWSMQLQNLWFRVLGHAARGQGFVSAGRLDEALEQLEQARVLSIDRNVSKGFAVRAVLPLLSATQLRRGDIDAACAAAKHGVELSRSMGYRHGESTNLLMLACSLLAAGDVDGAEARLAQASALAAAMPDAHDLPPRIEETHAELARHRRDAVGCERALREAARMHRENGEEWLAAQAEARIGLENAAS